MILINTNTLHINTNLPVAIQLSPEQTVDNVFPSSNTKSDRVRDFWPADWFAFFLSYFWMYGDIYLAACIATKIRAARQPKAEPQPLESLGGGIQNNSLWAMHPYRWSHQVSGQAIERTAVALRPMIVNPKKLSDNPPLP